MPFEVKAGEPIECLSLRIQLIKEQVIIDGFAHLYSGFSIAGGIDQNFHESPQGYQDNGIYITKIDLNSPADNCGLQIDDKILAINNYDFTTVTHKKAVEQIRRHPVLNLLIARKGISDD